MDLRFLSGKFGMIPVGFGQVQVIAGHSCVFLADMHRVSTLPLNEIISNPVQGHPAYYGLASIALASGNMLNCR